jgi:hypothetical protein
MVIADLQRTAADLCAVFNRNRFCDGGLIMGSSPPPVTSALVQALGYPPPGLPLFGGVLPYGPVTNRLVFCEQAVDNGTLTTIGQTNSITFRSAHTFAANTPYVRIAWCNWTPGSGNSTLSPVTINSAVDYFPAGASINNSIPQPLTFGGQPTATANPKGFFLSDPICGPFFKGDQLLVRTHVLMATSGQYWPTGMTLNRSYEGALAGDQTTAPNFDTSFVQQSVGGVTPCLICGPTFGRLPTVAGMGDSILDGVGDAGYSNNGFMERALDGILGYNRVSEPGETAATVAASLGFPCRGTVAANAGNLLCEYSTNDINQSSSLATLQANLIRLWLNAAAIGQRVFQTTCLPKTGSSDSFATVANQIPTGLAITGATNASPIVLTTNSAHNVTDGTPVNITGVGGNTAANVSGYAKATGYTLTTFGLYSNSGLTTPVAGNGAYTSGGLAAFPGKEVVRQAFNVWLRAGAPINASFAPVAVGTAGAILAGQPGHPLYAVFDTASAVEVNSSNVLTLNGGYWGVNGTAFWATIDGTHPTTMNHIAMAAKINLSMFL